MIYATVIAIGVLVTVLLANAPPARPETLPQQQTTTQTQLPPAPSEDCGCGVPSSPRGPR
jgi:hypothetical protein